MIARSDKTPGLPEPLEGLAGIATNLAWSWNRAARSLFRSIDAPLWRLTKHNPLELLRRVDASRLAACAADPDFLRRYHAVRDALAHDPQGRDAWYARSYPGLDGQQIAYFCAEFGLHNSVPIYSGGLGVLAGDHCKAASDLGVPLVGVGLMYTKGYFDQSLRLDGWQEDSAERFDPGLAPLFPVLDERGEPHLCTVEIFGRKVYVGAWKMMVGRVPVYLLDTNLDHNDPADRQLSHRLYAGGRELRLRQEWILGVGGVRVLRAVGIEPGAWHANEGHAAFMLLERLRDLVRENVPFEEAREIVRRTSTFTTHTPVPAGHDVFAHDLLVRCTGAFWEELGIDRDQFLGLGRHPDQDHDTFHMTAMAIRLSGRVNGVARRHGEVTREMWRAFWPHRPTNEVPIGHVTNGVHLQTWMSHRIKTLFDDHFGADWEERVDDHGFWERALEIDAQRLWAIKRELKGLLLDFIHEEARQRWRDQWREAPYLVGAGTLLNSSVMTIGFARRFATYKRADLIFSDVERLRRILVNPKRPVQIVFAGKAHPADDPGKKMLQRVYAFAHDPKFEGRIAFLEDYEMHMAHRLVQGVDLWLNVPRVPLEACGTSGMKAALNGVPQLGTVDGWWAEGFTGQNGWAIPVAAPAADADELDAEHLYSLLEREIIPLFYERDEYGLPTRWVTLMKQVIRDAGRFTARRMVQEYAADYYVPSVQEQQPTAEVAAD